MNENEKHSFRSFTRSSLNNPKTTCFLNCCILLVFYYNHTCYEAIHAVGQHFWTLFTSSIPCHPDRRRSHPRRSCEHCLLRTRLAQANSSSIGGHFRLETMRVVELQPLVFVHHGLVRLKIQYVYDTRQAVVGRGFGFPLSGFFRQGFLYRRETLLFGT